VFPELGFVGSPAEIIGGADDTMDVPKVDLMMPDELVEDGVVVEVTQGTISPACRLKILVVSLQLQPGSQQ